MSGPTPPAWRWPLLALLSWAGCWGLFLALGPRAGAPVALAAALLLGLALALVHAQRWRRLMVAGGFPLSLLAAGASMPGWAWGLALAVLALAYPWRGWRDAPLFPTPHAALAGLPGQLPLPPGSRVLDAGCGLGDGLLALRRAYPKAQLEGIEYSRPLAWLARLRCPWARIRRGDMWAQDWRGFDLVYLFQRPESMAAAADKARRELRPQAWLVSLDFPLPGVVALAELETGTRHRVWVYRSPQAAAQAGSGVADKARNRPAPGARTTQHG